MSVKDTIKKSVLESGTFAQYDMLKIMLAMTIALLMGCLIYMVYKKFYSGVVFSRSFAVTLVGMCVLTCIVISLGMVGALSIVRYRTAVKDPMDLLYLFWSITTGITAGAEMYPLVWGAAIIMIVMLTLFYHYQEKGKVYIAVIHYQDEAIRCFGKRKYFLKSKTMRKGMTEMAIEVFCKKEDTSFMEKIRAVEGVNDVTLIQYNGEYHG